MKDLDDLSELAEDWYRYLRAGNSSPGTIEQYRKAVDGLLGYLTRAGMPTLASDVGHRQIQRFIDHLATRPNQQHPERTVSAAYVSLHYRGLQQFWRWLCDVEQEVEINPFHRMRSACHPGEASTGAHRRRDPAATQCMQGIVIR